VVLRCYLMQAEAVGKVCATMACSRGKAAPDVETCYRLFAASGGYCENPRCTRNLFVATGSKVIQVAELAHVFAAMDQGPGASTRLSEAERGAFENWILLCPTCHTMVDEAESDFPAELLKAWKEAHASELARVFFAPHYAKRADTRANIEYVLGQNRAIFQGLNPDVDYQADTEPEKAAKWEATMRDHIIPNNRRVLTIIDVNHEHLEYDELVVVERFRQHVYDQEARHFTDAAPPRQAQFPDGMNTLLRAR
jgi:hypothetical protein